MRKTLAVIGAVLVGVLSGLAQEAAKVEIPIKSGQKIAFLGDSITAGGVGSAGYVTLTIAGLKANGIEATAIGAGISGHKSNDMLARLGRDVLEKKPDWMTLSCGVNDVWHGPRGVALEQYKSNITAIIDQAQAANVKVMILTATVITEDLNADNNKKLVPYNDFLRALAKEKNCLLADLNADFQEIIKVKTTPGNALTGDGVHMNMRGNEVMSKGILRAFGLDAVQLVKAEESWQDLPGVCDVSPEFKGTLKVSKRQLQKLEAIAKKYQITVPQMTRLLYGASALGGVPTGTAAEIEAFLTKNATQDPAATMQAGLSDSLKALLATPAP